MDGMAEAFWLGLQRSDRFITVFTSRLVEEDWRRVPPGFPNCALWTLGHLAWYRGLFLDLLTGRPRQGEDWSAWFAKGCTPPAPDDLPDLATCRTRLEAGLEDWRIYLERATDAELRAPLPEPSVFFASRAELLAHLTHHEAHHTGCLSMLSRALGREKVL
ncbi:MAG: DinB family protein [Candidatus Delongbacteria bacterium]